MLTLSIVPTWVSNLGGNYARRGFQTRNTHTVRSLFALASLDELARAVRMSTAAIEEHDSIERLLSTEVSFKSTESEITIHVMARDGYHNDPIRDGYVSFILESIEMALERERQETPVKA